VISTRVHGRMLGAWRALCGHAVMCNVTLDGDEVIIYNGYKAFFINVTITNSKNNAISMYNLPFSG
jgi:hypothetical protein